MTATNGTGAGRGWTLFFWAAAIFNFLIGAAAMLGPTPNVDTRVTAILVFAFGIVYAVTARDPDRYANVLWAGIFGKVAVVALMVTAGLDQENRSLMAGVLALDILFAFGFMVFLLTRSEYGEAAATDGETE